MQSLLITTILTVALLFVNSCNSSPAENTVKITLSPFQLGNASLQANEAAIKSPRFNIDALAEEKQPEVIRSILVGFLPANKASLVESSNPDPVALAKLLVDNYSNLKSIPLPNLNIVQSLPAPRGASVLVAYGTRDLIDSAESINKSFVGDSNSSITWGGFATKDGINAEVSSNDLLGQVEVRLYPLFCQATEPKNKPTNSCPIKKILSFTWEDGIEDVGVTAVSKFGGIELSNKTATLSTPSIPILFSPFGTKLVLSGDAVASPKFNSKDVIVPYCYENREQITVSNISISCDFDGDGDLIGDRLDKDLNGDGLIEIADDTDLFSINDDYATNTPGCEPCNGYQLIADITIPESTNWLPISSFSGVLSGAKTGPDGGKYYISGLTYEYAPLDNVVVERSELGLIGELTGTVMSLELRNTSIASSNESYTENVFYIGAIAAISTGTIDDVTVNGLTVSIPISSLSRTYYIGGLAGKTSGTIKDSAVSNIGAVSSANTVTQGEVAGWNDSGTIVRTPGTVGLE